MASVAERVFDLVKDTVEACGVELWDVRFLKEGASHYLRIFIDKADGVSINDCTDVSHAVDPLLDEADPIDKSYYLEVCSPGIERELTRDEHFAKSIGKNVAIKLFKSVDGIKEFTGVLKSFDGSITLETKSEIKTFEKGSFSKVHIIE